MSEELDLNQGLRNSIRIMYEKSGCTPAQIASAFNMDLLVVKAALAIESKIYRALESKVPITDMERQEMIEIIKDIARDTTNRGVQLAAAKYAYEEALGRNNAGGFGGNLQINIAVVNEGLLRAKQAKLGLKGIEGSDPASIELVENK